MKESKIIPIENQINSKILTIRSRQVMLDSDLAKLYGVETKVLNQAVKRNIERFPSDFCWQLSENEFDVLRSQFVTSNNNNYEDLNLRGGRRYLPYVFTQEGVAMLSSVLRSKTAIKVNIKIMRAFIKMRSLVKDNLVFISRLEKVEIKQIRDKIEIDDKFEKIFKALETKKPEFGIYYNDQLFDAYKFITDLVKSVQKRLILIDNFIDEKTTRHSEFISESLL